MSHSFGIEPHFPKAIFSSISEIRVQEPEIIIVEAARRKRRSNLTCNGKLVILAADHPGRGVTGSGIDPMVMGDRYEYLGRILRVLMLKAVDGVMGTPDVLEELLILNHLLRRQLDLSFLDEKVMIGSMNRGGLHGTRFEMRDRFGSFTPRQLHRMHFDGAKMMFRLDPQDPDSGATIQDCAIALQELDELNLPAFLEPLPVRKTQAGYEVVKSAEELVRVIGVASALGHSSRLLWLKVPYVADYARVARSTTCPILLLGGESGGDPGTLLGNIVTALAAGPNVRGVLVGRNILFPGDRDPAAMAAAVGRIVHEGASAEEAETVLREFRSEPSFPES